MARGKDARGAGVVDLAMGMSALKGRQNTARGKRSEPREATPGMRRIEPATAGVVDLAMGMSALKGDLSLVWFTVQTQENRSDYQRTKGKNTGNLPSMDLWLQEDCSRTWTYKRPSSAGSRYNS